MTTDMNTTTPLQTWWENTEFEGKEFCSLNENGELILNASGLAKEKLLSTLTVENADAVIRALVEKFPEVAAKVDELKTEWNETEDKQKMTGKVSRCKEYLLHVNAIGDFNALLEQVHAYDAILHDQSEENYKAKLALVQEAEALVDNNNWKDTIQAFKDLGEKWKNLGMTDRGRNDELHSRLEAAKTKFFDHKREQQESQGRDMLQNLDLKMEVVEKAENLAASENWKETTETFKQLMDQWKAIGHTMPDKNELLWTKFIAAKNAFFERKKMHFEQIQTEQEANLATKLAIIEKADAMKDSTDWNATSQAYTELMDQWKATGRVPLEKADELWNSFSAAKEVFFNAKRNHFETFRVTLEDNLAQKRALLKRALELKDSNQWRDATAEMNELMTEWKKIGSIPREHTNKIWEEFIGARKHFFDRKDADRDKRKVFAEKQKDSRKEQTRKFLTTLEAEVKEEEELLADFREGLTNITPGPKAKELQAHLTKLIAQGEIKIKHKQEKLEEVRKQLGELEEAAKPKAEAAPAPVASAEPQQQAESQENTANENTAAENTTGADNTADEGASEEA